MGPRGHPVDLPQTRGPAGLPSQGAGALLRPDPRDTRDTRGALDTPDAPDTPDTDSPVNGAGRLHPAHRPEIRLPPAPRRGL